MRTCVLACLLLTALGGPAFAKPHTYRVYIESNGPKAVQKGKEDIVGRALRRVLQREGLRQHFQRARFRELCKTCVPLLKRVKIKGRLGKWRLQGTLDDDDLLRAARKAVKPVKGGPKAKTPATKARRYVLDLVLSFKKGGSARAAKQATEVAKGEVAAVLSKRGHERVALSPKQQRMLEKPPLKALGKEAKFDLLIRVRGTIVTLKGPRAPYKHRLGLSQFVVELIDPRNDGDLASFTLTSSRKRYTFDMLRSPIRYLHEPWARSQADLAELRSTYAGQAGKVLALNAIRRLNTLVRPAEKGEGDTPAAKGIEVTLDFRRFASGNWKPIKKVRDALEKQKGVSGMKSRKISLVTFRFSGKDPKVAIEAAVKAAGATYRVKFRYEGRYTVYNTR